MSSRITTNWSTGVCMDSLSLSKSQLSPEPQDNLGIDSDDIDPVVLSTVSQRALKGYLRRVLPDLKGRMRERITEFLMRTSRGELTRDILRDLKWTWQEFAVQRMKHRGLVDIYRTMREMGEEWRKVLREEEAHRRAVDGVKEPVYYKGARVDTIAKYSDKLLELLLKADQPAKYREHVKHEHDHRTVTFHFGINIEDAKARLEEWRQTQREQ